MSSSDEEEFSSYVSSDDYISEEEAKDNDALEFDAITKLSIQRSETRFSSLFSRLSSKYLNGEDISAPDWDPSNQISPEKKHGVYSFDNITYGDDEDTQTEEVKINSPQIKSCFVALSRLAIPVAIHSSKSVTEESGLDESEDFIEKDSGLGDSLSSSPSGGETTDDSETKTSTICQQQEKIVPISVCPDNSSQSGAQIRELDKEDRRKDDESALPDNGSPVDVECNNPAFCGESVKVAPVLEGSIQQKCQRFRDVRRCDAGEPINESLEAALEGNQCGEGLTPHSPLQPAKSKLEKILKRRNFVTVRPRRLIDLSDKEEVETDKDSSPVQPKAPKKPRVAKPRKLKLWDIELGSDEAPIIIKNSPAKSHSSPLKSKNIQRKNPPKKIKKPEKQVTIQQLPLTSFWDSMTEFSENPNATITTKLVQKNEQKSVRSKRPELLDSSSCESDEDDFFDSMKKEHFFFSSRKNNSEPKMCSSSSSRYNFRTKKIC